MSDILNELLVQLKEKRDKGGNPTTYSRELNQTAAQIHKTITQICESGVRCGHTNIIGRILKMATVGPRRNTRFPYSISRHLKYDEGAEAYHKCELLVVESFEVRS